MECVFRAFNNRKPIAGAVSTNFSNRHIDILFALCDILTKNFGFARWSAQRERGENAEGM